MRRSPNGPEVLRLPLGQPDSPGPRRPALVATALVVCAIVAAVGPLSPAAAWASWARACAAGALVALAALASRVVGRRGPPRGWLVMDDVGLHRVDRTLTATLVEWNETFGLTVLASPDRAMLLLALTSARATRYVAANVRDAGDAAGARHVLERATTAAATDLCGGYESALCAADAERLFAEVRRRAPACVDRVVLSDAAGHAVVLDRAELRVGPRRIDLTAPLEWRASLFQERGAHAASVCQATWVQQGDVELVFVSPLPADPAWTSAGAAAALLARHAGGSNVDLSVARDVRLLQAYASEAPPREMRHAIDRVFMLPLRRALDRAPRASRIAMPPATAMPEGRA